MTENREYRVVNLPTCIPMFTTYNYKGAAGVASTPNKSFKNWFYNNSVMLRCNKKFLTGYTTPDLEVIHSDFIKEEEFEEHSCEDMFIDDMHFIIKRLIDQKYYVYFVFFDDYYIKGKSNYLKRHMPHDGLICGYDDKKETYKIAAYNEDWVFSIFDTPQKCLEEARLSELDGREAPSKLTTLRVCSEEIRLDVKKIKDLLSQYLKSNLWNTPAKPGEDAVGIVVHDFLGMYLDKLMDASIPYRRIDRRIFRMLWEHKECMLKRIRAVEDELDLDLQELRKEYKTVVDASNKMRIMYAKYCVKKDDRLLSTIKDKLKFVKKREKKLLKEFVRILN